MSSDTGSELSDEDGMIDQDSLWRDENEDELVRRRTQNLGLTKNYCRSWCRADAFREFYQNWRDALVSTFNLDPRAFKPVLKETPGRIAITVHSDVQAGDRMASNKLLGYILFTKKTGVLEMTNFKARLVPSMLNLGGTDKGDNDNLAGCHGEGFKLAALVMCRNGHSVGYTTNSQYWKFRFQGTGPSPTLRCQMSPAKPESVARKRADYMQKERSSSFRRGFTSNLWQDVRVRIGTAKGEEGRQISLPEFRAWLEVVLEIDSPNAAQIVQTGHGDLIVDERFSGRIYLKGLRVSGHSLDGRNYEFGYNYIRGEINRDRDLLTSRNEEALMLARIWEEAIDEKGDAFADRYISLFQDKEKAPDICLADDFAFRHTVRTMWARLRSLHPDTFFYSESKSQESNMTTDCDIITKDFKKTPMMLNKGFWKLLAKHALVRSPYKERAHRFSASTPIPVPGDIFAVNVARGLQGSFQLNPKLQNIRIEFVQAGETEIDLMYTANENRLRIHEKWLDFERVHATSECEYYQLTHDHSVERPVFICDHVVLDLLEIALEEIRGPLGMSQGECVALRSKADKRVRQMPRLVNISASDAGDELCVSWVDSENTVLSEMFNADIMYQVELHSMTTCSEKCRDIVDRQGKDPFDMPIQCAKMTLMQVRYQMAAKSVPVRARECPGQCPEQASATSCARSLTSQWCRE
ncbi:hypothetical protein A1O3_04125 [Capronia epimyces CBS 606.96]|uniref:Uncharacterized protein n=1 Tax=Capronia epimyces CBS 606.96 TaxID=1182542 RepID=W9YD28_9EURO|nr:uncharacterized protein A1O3_04125 [Capronia epimyces CBS 606.96]EXJ87166.1 hypothetical protein A1O3_04125 [Capronia epimyces CBS 606.96]